MGVMKWPFPKFICSYYYPGRERHRNGKLHRFLQRSVEQVEKKRRASIWEKEFLRVSRPRPPFDGLPWQRRVSDQKSIKKKIFALRFFIATPSRPCFKFGIIYGEVPNQIVRWKIVCKNVTITRCHATLSQDPENAKQADHAADHQSEMAKRVLLLRAMLWLLRVSPLVAFVVRIMS